MLVGCGALWYIIIVLCGTLHLPCGERVSVVVIVYSATLP